MLSRAWWVVLAVLAVVDLTLGALTVGAGLWQHDMTRINVGVSSLLGGTLVAFVAVMIRKDGK